MKPLINKIIIAKCKKMIKKDPSIIEKATSKEKIKEDLENTRKYHETRDTNCFNYKDTRYKDTNIEEIKLDKATCWIISRDENPKDKIIYYMHGGGFAAGSTCECYEFITRIVKKWHYNVCSVDYRMIPEHNIDEILKDCEDGYNVLLKRYKNKDICFLGDSAGGHLVFSLSHKLKDDNISLPGGIVALSPVMQFRRYAYSYYECSWKTDFGITFGINERVYPSLKGKYDFNHKYVSPLCGDFKDFPKVYIDASNIESLRDEAKINIKNIKGSIHRRK